MIPSCQMTPISLVEVWGTYTCKNGMPWIIFYLPYTLLMVRRIEVEAEEWVIEQFEKVMIVLLLQQPEQYL